MPVTTEKRQAPSDPHAAAAELVRRAQAGDRAAFGALVRRYRERIFALVLHLTGSESDADDITQEVFWGAYRHINQFAGRSEFFTWVYRIAVNRALNAKRDRSRRSETPLDDPRIVHALAADASGDPARAAELRQTYARLLFALDSLPFEMMTTVVLVALQGMSHAEVAVIQECSPGTVAWRIHQARGKLQRALLTPRKRTTTSPELQSLLEQCGLPALAG